MWQTPGVKGPAARFLFFSFVRRVFPASFESVDLKFFGVGTSVNSPSSSLVDTSRNRTVFASTYVQECFWEANAGLYK